MPELPEVETIRRDLEPYLVGRRITRIDLICSQTESGRSGPRAEARGEPKRYGHLGEATGRTIAGLARRGKYLLAELSGLELVIHLGMSGRLYLAQDVVERRHLRAHIQLEGPQDLYFFDMRKFGTLRLVPSGCYVDLPTLQAMGPEPLSETFLLQDFVAATAVCRTPIKAALLAQKLVAGIGNIYADEALHRARIHPEARGLTQSQAMALHGTIKAVLEEAIANRGTTFDLYRDAKFESGKHLEHLWVFQRDGRPCRTCGARIVKTRVAGRGTHLCPACQQLK